MEKFKNEVKNKKNIYILIDEAHYGAKEKQIISNTFKDLKLYDEEYLKDNNTKIIEISATPDGIAPDIFKYTKENQRFILKMNPGEGYISCFDLLNNNQVRQYKPLVNLNSEDQSNVLINIKEILNLVIAYITNKYHIIRCSTQKDGFLKTIKNFKKIFRGFDIEFKEIIEQSNTSFDILKKKPMKHTLIFIKEEARCALTFYKKYIGICYERYTKRKVNNSAIIQGLLGRCTGYGLFKDIIIFTDIESIKKYEIIYNDNFSEISQRKVKWNCTTKINSTRYTSGKTETKTYKIKMTIFDMLNCDIFKKTKDYINNELSHILKRKFNCSKDYNHKKLNECTIRGETKIWHVDEIKDKNKCGLGKDRPWRRYFGYKNINDPSTLVVIVYYIDEENISEENISEEYISEENISEENDSEENKYLKYLERSDEKVGVLSIKKALKKEWSKNIKLNDLKTLLKDNFESKRRRKSETTLQYYVKVRINNNI